MRFLRKVFFYLFVALYLVFCPILILYALGYIYRPGEELGIVKSGLIYVSTAPSGASVYLGNRRYTRRTPALLPDLIPGNYPVRLVLKNRKPWMDTLPVEAGKATILERILLLPEQWNREDESVGPFQDLIAVLGNRFFLLSRGLKAKDLFIYDSKDEKTQPLLRPSVYKDDTQFVSQFSVEKSTALILHLDSKEGRQFLWVMPKGKEIRIKDLTHFFQEEPHQIEWDPQEKRYLFAFQGGHLNRLDVVNDILAPRFLERVRGFGISDKKIYVLRDDFIFERMDFEGGREKILFQDPVLGKSLFGEGGFYEIYVFSDDVILFLGEEGELLANRLPYQFAKEGVLGLQFYPKLKRLLIWKRNALGILDFSKEPYERTVFETGPELIWVYQQGNDIEQAFWVYEGSHILFQDGNKVFLLELEAYGKPRLAQILEVEKGSSIFYSEDSGKLYYLGSRSGDFSSIEILPKWEILPLAFPEEETQTKEKELGE